MLKNYKNIGKYEMNRKLTLLAILMAIIPVFVSAAPQYQHELVTAVLSHENTSYMAKTMDEKVYVTTFNYKTPAETCKFLQNRGVNVVQVTNWTDNKDNPNALRTSITKDC